MIGYVTVGTNDLARAATFYDALLAEIGGRRAMEDERYIGWGAGEGSPLLLVMKAIALGARDEGAPGNRGGSFYGAYCRDLDGNKLCFFVM